MGDSPFHGILLQPAAKVAQGGYVHAVETFGAVDGPGLRYVLFTAGCKMRCLYCHNPDSWARRGGEWKTVEQVASDIGRYAAFYRRTGGLTVSGGEPLLQADFVGEVFRQVKRRFGLHTTLDTDGSQAARLPDAWFDAVDLVLLDIKHIDPDRHKALTGLEVHPILAFARRLAVMGKPAWIRYVLVPGHTDDLLDVERLADFIAPLKNVQRIEILPFHKMGEAKWKELGRNYQLADVAVPSHRLIDRVRRQFACRGLPVAA